MVHVIMEKNVNDIALDRRLKQLDRSLDERLAVDCGIHFEKRLPPS